MTLRPVHFAVVLCTVLLAPALIAGSPVELLRTGSFHGDEIAPGSGGSWLALVFESGGLSLHAVKATITSEEDPIVDDPGEMTGKTVTITPPVDAVALIRGIPVLKPGPVPTAVINRVMEPDGVVSLHLKNQSYSLNLRCRVRSPVDGQTQEQCDLVLGSRGTHQILFTYLRYSDGQEMQWASEREPVVIWAGDIDGDQRMDILLDSSDHYNGEEFTLYLSSMATGENLVQPVAVFDQVGC